MLMLRLCRWLKETAAAHEELSRTNKGLASIRSNVKQLVSLRQQQQLGSAQSLSSTGGCAM